MKLEIFGDSVLKGVMYTESGRYKIYDERLNSRLAEMDIGLERNCRIGSTVGMGYERLEKRFLENPPDRDDTFLLEFGGNDSDYNWKEIAENCTGDHFCHTLPEKYLEIYGRMIEKIKGFGVKNIFVSTLIPIDAEKYLNFIGKTLDKEKILSWLGDTSMLYRFQESYSRLAEKVAGEYGCRLVDLRTPFLLSHDFSSLLSSDGIHPTQKGHELIENVIFDSVVGNAI